MRFNLAKYEFCRSAFLFPLCENAFRNNFQQVCETYFGFENLTALKIFWQPTSTRHTKKVRAIKEPWKQI